MIRLARAAVSVALLAGGPAFAQQRPSDQEIFGAPVEPKPEGPGEPPAAVAPPAAPGPAPSTSEGTRDEAILGAPDTRTRLSEEVAPEDPLRIGGMFYLRAQTVGLEGEAPDEWSLSAPSLVDLYLDARPNERVRGLILGRMLFDPTLPSDGGGTPQLGGLEASGATMGTAPLSSLLGRRTRGPRVALDQMWLRFDLHHRVFVTAGKQHVRWGTARFWSPTDFLHLRRRNPLDVFDARTGTTMLKLHVPWEARGWNFYAYGVTENEVATPTLAHVAGAARAEVVLGTTEIGLGAFFQRDRKPKWAIDASTGIWDVDLHGELALRYGSEIDRVRVQRAIDPAEVRDLATLLTVVEQAYPAERVTGVKPQAVAGATYSRRYNDNDVFNVGVEYFYNALGYGSADAYPGLVLPRARALAEPATFFYLGRHYGAVFVNVPAPYSWDLTTFTLSTLGNFSDGSFISRLDYALVLLTHLRFEAFAAVRFGSDDGEFRFGVPALERSPALIDLGVALRVSL